MVHKLRSIIVLSAAVMLAGCGMIYTNVRVPRSYRSATPGDIKGEKTDKLVTGEACNRSVLFMVAWGDGGYASAVRSALKDDQGSILYDVTADTRLRSYLGLYTCYCTIVSGKVARP